MAFDVSALTAFVDENADIFLEKSVLGAKTPALANIITGLKGTAKIPNLAIDTDDLFQDGTGCVTTDQGNVVFDQRTITPKNFKVLMKFCVKDLEAFFTRKILTPGSSYDSLTTIESQIMDLIGREIMKKIELILWQGVEGGAAGDVSFNLMDGYEEIIADEIVAGSIPAPQRTTVSEAVGTVVSAYEGMRRNLPIDQFEEAADGGYLLLTDPVSKRNYEEAWRSTFTSAPYNMSFDKPMLDGTNIPIIGVGGLHGLGKSILVKQKSLWVGVDLEGEETNLVLERGTGNDRDNMYLHADFKMAAQLNFPSELVTNNFT